MAYRAQLMTIPQSVRDDMLGVSWHSDPRCPSFDMLVLLRLVHWDMQGAEQIGEMVVAAEIGEDVARIFERLHAAHFPIERMERVATFGGCDNRSMAANNTSAFNFRVIAGTSRLSLHAFGAAIDINPVQNPYVGAAAQVFPPLAVEYVERTHLRPGMITRPGPVIDAFDAFGWNWGGDWNSPKDYQHFSFPLPGTPTGTR